MVCHLSLIGERIETKLFDDIGRNKRARYRSLKRLTSMSVAQKVCLYDWILILEAIYDEARLRDQLVVGQSSGCHVSLLTYEPSMA